MESIYKLGVIVSAVDKLTGPVKNMAGSVQNLEDQMNKAKKMVDFGQRLSIAGAMTQGAADQMKGTLKGLLQPTLDLKSAMKPLETVTTSTMGSIEESLNATKKAAVDWSKTHTQSADEYIRTSYMMASAGLNDVQAIEATETALTVAKATMADSADTANLVATMYNNMGDKTADVSKEMSRMGDVLTKTQQLFQLKNLGQLNEGLKYAIPTALQFGNSVEELNVVLGQLNNAGMQGSMAGTAFAASMRKMISASEKLGFEIARTEDGGISYIGTLQNIRKQFGSFDKMSDQAKMAFQKAFGEEGLRAISLLTNKTGEMNEALGKVKNSAGAAANAQSTMEAPPTEQYKILANNLDALKRTLSTTLIPALNEGITKAIQFVNKLEGFAKAHPEITKTGMLIFGIATAVLAIAAPIMTVFGSLIMLAGYSWQGIIKLHKGFLKLKGFLSSGKISKALTSMKSAFSRMFAAVKTGVSSAISGIKSFTVNLYRMGKRAVVSAYNSMKSLAISVYQFGKNAAMQAVAGLKSMALGLVNMARRAITAAATAIPSLVASVWSFTAALLANPITWIVVGIAALTAGIYALYKNWDQVSAFLQGVWQSTVDKVVAAFNWIKNVLENTSNKVLAIVSVFLPFIGIPALLIKNWDKVGPYFKKVWSVIKNSAIAAFNFIKDGFAKLAYYLTNPLELAGIVWNAIKISLNNALNWVKGLFNVFSTAGKGLWNAFVDGLKSVISKPVDVVKSGLQKVRDMLPFSDAKTGPLSNLTKSGKALIQTFNSGLDSESGNLVSLFKNKLSNLTGYINKFQLPGLQNLQKTNLPTLPDLVGKAKYMLDSLNLPSLKDIKAKIIYTLDIPDIPDFPDFPKPGGGGKPAPAAGVLSYNSDNINIPSFGSSNAKQKQNQDNEKDKPLVIQGDVKLIVKEVNRPNDLVDALKTLKDELGG